MKNSIKLVSLLLIISLFSCNKESLVPGETSEQTVIDENAKKSTVPVLDLNLEEIPGTSSTIHRKSNGIKVKFKTENLIPGNAYTLWFVIFSDLGGPPMLVTYADGRVIGGSGKGVFTAHLNVGDIFDNPMTAEVHLALRTHGPVQSDMMPEQIQTMNGGCTSGFDSGQALYDDSEVIGYCANIQVAMHDAVNE